MDQLSGGIRNAPGASRTRQAPRRSPRGEPGFSLLEVTLAAVILVILAGSIVTAGLHSRKQLDLEETRRRAIAIGQARLERVRARFSFDDIVKAKIDTTITLDGTVFTLRSNVTNGSDPADSDSLDEFVKFATDTVVWYAQGWNVGQTIQRRVVMGTYFFGGLLEGP